MIETIDINNYKCFEKVRVSGCRRVNIIVGDNGSGKTALLEALFMSSGPNPELALRVRNWRGFDSRPTGASRDDIEEALWGELFHAFDKKRTILISTTGSPEHVRSLTINYRVRERWVRVQGGRSTQKNRPTPITFIWMGPDRVKHSLPVIVTPEGKMSVQVGPEVPVQMAFFGSNLTFSSHETATRFSELSRANKEGEVAKYLEQYYGIEGVSIELNAGAPMVYGRKPPQTEKIPLPSLSGGLNRLAPILFSIACFPKGAICIDEIEAGFYYQRMPKIWEMLLHLADEHESQIFASTHSAECLAAAAKIAEQYPEKFALIRATNREGKSKLELFDGSDFASVIEAGFDPRSS